MSRNKMKLSVCLALYKGEHYIHDQLTSILSQLGAEDEVIVVNDNSPDASSEIVGAFADRRIHLVNNEVNRGVIASIERALSMTTGDIIFLADQDDVWLPGKVETILAAFRTTPSYAVISDAKIIDSQGRDTGQTHFAVRNSGPGVIKNWWRNSYVGCCMAIDARIRPLILPFPADIPMHDAWIGTVCDFVGQVYFLPTPLVGYRRHGENSTELVGTNPIFMVGKRLKWLSVLARHLPRIRQKAKHLGLWQNHG